MIFKGFENPTLNGDFTKLQGLQKHCLIKWHINKHANEALKCIPSVQLHFLHFTFQLSFEMWKIQTTIYFLISIYLREIRNLPMKKKFQRSIKFINSHTFMINSTDLQLVTRTANHSLSHKCLYWPIKAHFGSSKLILAYNGSSWNIKDPHGSSRLIIAHLGTSQLISAYGSFRLTIARLGTSWLILAHHGSSRLITAHLGT